VGAEALAYALKIVVNIVYGLTSARFENPFRDVRNKDNIVAKRGALFMIDIKEWVMDQGFQVVHIKTDSIKIPDATPELIQALINHASLMYGYTFEHEVTYDKFCLVNDAVYIARADGKWTAVGAQFAHPYVYKTLFSGEELEFDDLCEVKNVIQGAMYLDMQGSEDVSNMRYVGRTGSFMPVRYDGGDLWRIKDGKKYAVTGTKGHKWIERERAIHRYEVEKELYTDMDYFAQLEQDAIAAISAFGSFEEFVS
jgi:hypothetical protein